MGVCPFFVLVADPDAGDGRTGLGRETGEISWTLEIFTTARHHHTSTLQECICNARLESLRFNRTDQLSLS